jgi:hypothetical protein
MQVSKWEEQDGSLAIVAARKCKGDAGLQAFRLCYFAVM